MVQGAGPGPEELVEALGLAREAVRELEALGAAVQAGQAEEAELAVVRARALVHSIGNLLLSNSARGMRR